MPIAIACSRRVATDLVRQGLLSATIQLFDCNKAAYGVIMAGGKVETETVTPPVRRACIGASSLNSEGWALISL